MNGPVVEDNERNLKLVRDVLRHAGCDWSRRGDGRGGARACAARRPDVILMDINLPGMTGVEALARAAGRRGDGAIPSPR